MHRKNESSILIRGRENSSFSLNLRDELTDRRTDISNYRVASLLKKRGSDEFVPDYSKASLDKVN